MLQWKLLLSRKSVLIADHKPTHAEDAFERGTPVRINSDKQFLPIWKLIVAQVCVTVKAAKLRLKEKPVWQQSSRRAGEFAVCVQAEELVLWPVSECDAAVLGSRQKSER